MYSWHKWRQFVLLLHHFRNRYAHFIRSVLLTFQSLRACAGLDNANIYKPNDHRLFRTLLQINGMANEYVPYAKRTETLYVLQPAERNFIPKVANAARRPIEKFN